MHIQKFNLASLIFLLLISNAIFGQSDVLYQSDSAILKVIESIEIPATATGPIESISVREGSIVSAGQSIARINDLEVQNQKKQAQIDLKVTEARLESEVEIEFARKSLQVAQADLERAIGSNQRYAGVVSDREMDRLRLTVEQSKAELEKVKFENSLLAMDRDLKEAIVEKYDLAINRHSIVPATTGQIVEVMKKEGEWVNLSDPMFRLIRLDRLKIEVFVSSSDADSELVDTAAEFKFEKDSNKNVAEGKVTFVSPEVNPVNGTVAVWVEFENSALKLRPGTKGQLKIYSSSQIRSKKDGRSN